jgi:hypothetical protein
MDFLIVDVSASTPNSNALFVIVACIARYSSSSNVMDSLKQESAFDVGINDPLLQEALLETITRFLKTSPKDLNHLGLLKGK